jgi:hypothetical protein
VFVAKRPLIFFSLLIFSLGVCPVRAQDYTFRELAETEANYILECQFQDETSPAHGAINNLRQSYLGGAPRERYGYTGISPGRRYSR